MNRWEKKWHKQRPVTTFRSHYFWNFMKKGGEGTFINSSVVSRIKSRIGIETLKREREREAPP